MSKGTDGCGGRWRGGAGIHPDSLESKMFDTAEMDYHRRGACEEERRRALGLLWTEGGQSVKESGNSDR